MNKSRRKRIGELVDRLAAIRSELDELVDEEQEAFDNMPEQFQDGGRGDKMYEAIDLMETASSDISDIETSLEDLL